MHRRCGWFLLSFPRKRESRPWSPPPVAVIGNVFDCVWWVPPGKSVRRIGVKGSHASSAPAIRLHQRCGYVAHAVRRISATIDSTWAASGRTDTGSTASPDVAAAVAARRRTQTAIAPTLPGRHAANTTSATQIQPRPLIMLKKKRVERRQRQEGPRDAHQRRARDDGARTHGDRDRRPARPPAGSRRPCARPGRWVCDRAARRSTAPAPAPAASAVLHQTPGSAASPSARMASRWAGVDFGKLTIAVNDSAVASMVMPSPQRAATTPAPPSTTHAAGRTRRR